jgi:SDR family mycofactocin-dependent oxidoreductase
MQRFDGRADISRMGAGCLPQRPGSPGGGARMSRELEMAGLLEGKVVVITGAARGQGRAHALLSAQEGADVVVIDIARQLETVPYPMARPEDLKDTAAQVEALGRRALAVQADVRDQAQMDAAVADAIGEFGKIDAFIANAGIWTRAPFWELTDQQWDETISVNLSGVWRSVKAVAPHMIERQAGSIVLTSSVNGIRPGYDYAHYVAAKFGVIGLMKAIALELSRHGIRCNAVLPGGTDTAMTNNQGTWDWIAGHESANAQVFRDAGYHHTALKGRHWMAPEDMAKAALYFNSDLAANVTGETIAVDAGGGLLPAYNTKPVR